MQRKDYYKILGVGPDATQDMIRIAYRKLARKYHPDISREKNAEERFKEIGEAYEFLKDPLNRRAYEKAASKPQTARRGYSAPGRKARVTFPDNRFKEHAKSGIGRFFGTLIRHARNSIPPKAKDWLGGKDHHARIEIDLADSYRGANRRITLHLPSSDKSGSFGNIERVLDVRIPIGVKPGQRIRLSGQGIRKNRALPAGDVYLEIEFKNHPFFRVKGSDVYLDLPVAPWEAVLGARVKIPTPEGRVEVQIPAGSKHGTQIRLRNRGIPGPPNGHFYAAIQIELPPAESEKDKNVYRDMARRLTFNPRAKFDAET